MTSRLLLSIGDKEVKVCIGDNMVTFCTIRNAFLLPPDAILKMSYTVEEEVICCS